MDLGKRGNGCSEVYHCDDDKECKILKTVRPDSTKWTIGYVSAMEGNTPSSTDTITITDLQFFVGGDTIEVTPPPTDYYLLMGGIGRYGLHVLKRDLNRQFAVQATVISSSPDTDIVVLHHPTDVSEKIRSRMTLLSSTANGNGTYTRVYRFSWTGDYPGRYNVCVSAFTRNSIYDNQAAVTSQDWGIPYIVQ